MDNARIENDNIVFPTRYGRMVELVFPIELLEAVSNLGQGAYKIEEALMFYKITKDAPEWRWTTPRALAGTDLTGWEFYYYESNYEDSRWSNVWLSREIRSIGELADASYESVDLEGEADSWVLEANQEILLVKLTNEEFAKRIAQNLEQTRKHQEWTAERAIRDAKEDAQRSNDPLDEWERELLALNDEDAA